MDLEKKNILIVGLGVTGLAVARFLKDKGARLTVTDAATEFELADVIPEVKEMGIRLELGQHRAETFRETDLIVVSPGVPHTLPALTMAKEKGIPVLGEIELACRFVKEPIVAVTGTNGKTTTTALLGEMLKRSGYSVFVGGNIGTPLVSYLGRQEKSQWIVLEVSSFQLDTIDIFRPKIGVLLNITDDHLNRYPDFDAYADSKGRLFENQHPEDTAVLNAADPAVQRVSRNVRSRKWMVNAPSETGPGAVIDADNIVIDTGDGRKRQIDRSTIGIRGFHNAENVAAAGLAALAAGGSMDGIRSAISRFGGLAHRVEYVGTKQHIRYFNDSKATNTDAVKAALSAFDEPVILIMGGRDKGANFELLKSTVQRQVKKLVLMGEAASDIDAVLKDAVPVETVRTMEEAVRCAHRSSSPGDTVLLSPGCTSFDQYRNYKQRGEDFRKIVENL